MLTAFLLFSIGSADLIRSRYRWKIAVGAIVVMWILAAYVAVAGLAVPLPGVALMLVVAVAWLATTTATNRGRSSFGLYPTAGLVAVILATLAFDDSSSTLSGFVVDWYQSAPMEAVRSVPLPTLMLGAAIALFLAESSNIIVRASLARHPQPSVELPATADSARLQRGQGWRFRARGTTAPVPSSENEPGVEGMKGGRSIGVIERILIVALTLSGALVIAGAVIAAKGIVRFPEISHDGRSGSKAEYFLVGSLVSWAISFGAVGLLIISAQN